MLDDAVDKKNGFQTALTKQFFMSENSHFSKGVNP